MSREHHHGLLVGWKIRMGIRNEIDPSRIRRYLNWFYTHHLVPHFVMEEHYLFPILGAGHEEVQTALEQHYQIHQFFIKPEFTIQDLQDLEQLMTQHIRFEERVLFNTIQSCADEETLHLLDTHLLDEDFTDNETDPFWL